MTKILKLDPNKLLPLHGKDGDEDEDEEDDDGWALTKDDTIATAMQQVPKHNILVFALAHSPPKHLKK